MWGNPSFSSLGLLVTERASVASDALALPARGLRFATSPVDLGGLSPAVVGVVLGALVGVVVFIGVVVVVAMRGHKRAVASSASPALSDEVVVIPPYTTAREADPFSAAASGARPSRAPSFAPTSELSARALSRMGYDVDASAGALAPAPVQEWVAAAPSSTSFPPPSASSIPVMIGASSSDLLSSDLLVDDESGPARLAVPKAPETQPIVGAPVVMVGPPVVTVGGEAMEIPPPPSGPVSRPHPLSVLAKLPALTAQRAAAPPPTGASVADLELDDCPTEIAETIFDEPPQPLHRGSRPKIRRVDPVAPRFETPRPAAGRPASEPPPALSSRPPPRHSGIVYSPDDAGPTEVFLVRKVSRPA